MNEITVRFVAPDDWLVWERMRYALWPGDDEEHGEVVARFFRGERTDPEQVLLAEAAGEVIAFAELSIRTDLPGLLHNRIGYVEGLYVAPQVRHKGVARALLAASRQWARARRCTGFASDRDDRVIVDNSFIPSV